MPRKYYITENHLDIDIIFTIISRGMIILRVIIKMEITAIMVTLLVPIIKDGETSPCTPHSWSYISTLVYLSVELPYLTRIFLKDSWMYR